MSPQNNYMEQSSSIWNIHHLGLVHLDSNFTQSIMQISNCLGHMTNQTKTIEYANSQWRPGI